MNTFNPKNIKHMVINLTNECNLRCKYCFTEHNPKRMKLDTLKQAIKFGIETCNVKRISFFGGEPMLEYKTLIQPIIQWVKEQKINVSFGMTTNGTLFTSENLKWLKENNVGFLLSIDGDKDSQNYNRPTKDGTNSFELIQPNIKQILDLFPKTTFRSTITPYSANNLIQDYLFARKQGFQYYYIVPDCLNFQWTSEDLSILFSNYAQILEIMYRDITVGMCPLEISQFVKAVERTLPFVINPNKPTIKTNINRCGLGTTGIGISPEGYISGCQEHCTYEETPFYIGDIWNGFDINKQKTLWEYIENNHYISNPNQNCQKCPNNKMCSAHYCPSHNWINHKDLSKQDDISCKWNTFQNGISIILLDKAARENNGIFSNWLTDRLKKNQYSKN